ncbi:polyprenyl synthetase family protein [bacterium]|nr:polyprenyl synthetase family protein [bacterium]
MNIESEIKKLHDKINRGLMEIFEGRPPESLYGPVGHLLKAGGKRIRPLLVIFSCKAAGGPEEACFNAALAIELLHTFTLVHDDIMDDDDSRRGMPSVHKKWDIPTAILAGDGLVTLAYQTLLKTDHPRLVEAVKVFTDGLLLLCEGQAMDKDLENRECPELEEYMDMIGKKTGKLIEVCCDIGAILGDAAENERRDLKKFGSYTGRAFQIQDDMLDILSRESVFGKPIASDIIQKKNTFLTIHLWQNGDNDTIGRFRSLWGKEILSIEEIEVIRECFDNAGSFDAAREIVKSDLENAMGIADSLTSSGDTSFLKYLVKLLKNRSC